MSFIHLENGSLACVENREKKVREKEVKRNSHPSFHLVEAYRHEGDKNGWGQRRYPSVWNLNFVGSSGEGLNVRGRVGAGSGSVERGARGGHAGAQVPRLQAPEQLLIVAAQALLLIGLLLHVFMQVGILLRQLPGGEQIMLGQGLSDDSTVMKRLQQTSNTVQIKF